MTSWSRTLRKVVTGDALVELAELREPVDAFFDKVMVMVDDKELRLNRLDHAGETARTVPAALRIFRCCSNNAVIKKPAIWQAFLLSLNNTATFNNLLLNKDYLIY